VRAVEVRVFRVVAVAALVTSAPGVPEMRAPRVMVARRWRWASTRAAAATVADRGAGESSAWAGAALSSQAPAAKPAVATPRMIHRFMG
jgi:hypothetical protein